MLLHTIPLPEEEELHFLSPNQTFDLKETFSSLKCNRVLRQQNYIVESITSSTLSCTIMVTHLSMEEYLQQSVAKKLISLILTIQTIPLQLGKL